METTQSAGIERRRSPRIPWRIPFVLTWRANTKVTVREQGETEVVNAHGALVRLSAKLYVGQPVTILGKGKHVSQPAHVVGNHHSPGDGFTKLAVELSSPGMEFWTQIAR